MNAMGFKGGNVLYCLIWAACQICYTDGLFGSADEGSWLLWRGYGQVMCEFRPGTWLFPMDKENMFSSFSVVWHHTCKQWVDFILKAEPSSDSSYPIFRMLYWEARHWHFTLEKLLSCIRLQDFGLLQAVFLWLKPLRKKRLSNFLHCWVASKCFYRLVMWGAETSHKWFQSPSCLPPDYYVILYPPNWSTSPTLHTPSEFNCIGLWAGQC